MNLELTRTDKVLWPRTGFTKGQMLEYYRAIAPAMLPHLRDRATTLVRFPDGVDGPGWYQNDCRGAPEWLRVWPVRAQNGRLLRYAVVDDLPSLLWLANLATIEFHPFLARIDAPDRPSWLVFDLDPGRPANLIDAGRVALAVREALERRGLAALVKTSGAKGIHVWSPAGGAATYAETKPLARAIARELAAADPERVVDRMARRERAGRVFIDWSQNSAAKSMIAPYSLRATPVPQVSLPIEWDELERAVVAGDPSQLRFGPADALAPHGTSTAAPSKRP